jgi:hypothetical protein
MMNHLLSVKMGELYWQCFECVSFRHIGFDRRLKLFIGKSDTTNSFEFIVK